MKDLPADPEDKGDDASTKSNTRKDDSAGAKPKRRKRRTKLEIEADDAAIALGFKNAADQAEQESSMGESKEAEAKEPKKEPSPQPDEEVVQVTVTPTGLQEGTRWNLGGTAFVLDTVESDGVLVFRPAIGYGKTGKA
jgi:hypothetical protein